MSFAGVTLIRDGKLCPSRSIINDAGAASGYHLLVVEGHSRSEYMADIKSRRFRVGGHLWFLEYWPNFCRPDGSASICDSICLHQDVAGPVKAQFRFSFIDQPDKQRSKYKPYSPGKYGYMSFSNLLTRDDLEQSRHVEDDGFTIRCDIIVEDFIDAGAGGSGTSSPFITVPPPDMQQHFADLLAAKEGTDVKFEVDGETFNAHRCILAARSQVFKAELFGPMKEGTTTADAIHVEDMEAPAFRAMLKFIYTDLEPEMEKGDGEDPVWQCQNLLVAADRYDLQRLKLMCEDKLCGFIDVNTTPTILTLAERHCCDGLKTACYNFLGASGNLRAVAASDGFDNLITSCPSVMKELINMFVT